MEREGKEGVVSIDLVAVKKSPPMGGLDNDREEESRTEMEKASPKTIVDRQEKRISKSDAFIWEIAGAHRQGGRISGGLWVGTPGVQIGGVGHAVQ